jgi:hypothetical protein
MKMRMVKGREEYSRDAGRRVCDELMMVKFFIKHQSLINEGKKIRGDTGREKLI